jgi:hypothetical protein
MAAALLAGSAAARPRDNPHFKIMGAVAVWGSDAGSAVPVVSDFIINTGTGAVPTSDRDLISGDVHTVVTGSLIPTKDAVNSVGTMPFLITNTAQGTVDTDTNNDGILNASDAFTPFGLRPNSDTVVDTTASRSSFFIASNTPFAIDARATAASTPLATTLLNIVRLQLTSTVSGNDGLAFGTQAQAAHTGGPNAGFSIERPLSQFTAGRRIFTGNRRTALARGSLADQSIRFDATYTIRAASLSGYDLSLGTFDFEVDVVYTVFVP